MLLKPQILLGDCMQGLRTIDDNSVDLILADPPYFDYKTGHRKDKEDKLSQSLVQQSQEDQLRTMQECIRVLKDGHSFWFFTNWQEAWWFQARFHSFLRNEIIWEKGNWAAGDLEGSLGCRYEVIFLGTKGKGWKYNGPRIQDVWSQSIDPDPRYNLNRVGTKRLHSTEKPVDLYKKIIELSTQPGDLVLDAYVGSGSSAEASLMTGRNFIGWEIDPIYHQRATDRIKRCIND